MTWKLTTVRSLLASKTSRPLLEGLLSMSPLPCTFLSWLIYAHGKLTLIFPLSSRPFPARPTCTCSSLFFGESDADCVEAHAFPSSFAALSSTPTSRKLSNRPVLTLCLTSITTRGGTEVSSEREVRRPIAFPSPSSSSSIRRSSPSQAPCPCSHLLLSNVSRPHRRSVRLPLDDPRQEVRRRVSSHLRNHERASRRPLRL
jgi:hypothetical protein